MYVQAPGAQVYQIHGPTSGEARRARGSGRPRRQFDAPVVTGFDWMLSCSVDFEDTVAFMEDGLGLPMAERGDARFDRHFSRYAFGRLPSGATLEVVEPTAAGEHMSGRQILCLTAPNFLEAERELQRRRAVLDGDVVRDDDDLAWVYLRAPDGRFYQV